MSIGCQRLKRLGLPGCAITILIVGVSILPLPAIDLKTSSYLCRGALAGESIPRPIIDTLIMEKHLDRKLIHRKEHVHHLNGNKLDNRIENLALLTPSTHGRYHAKQYKSWKKMYQDRIAELESMVNNLTT